MGCFRATFWQAGQRQPSAESETHRFHVTRRLHRDLGVNQCQRTVCLRGRRSSPFLYAVEVEDVETALAAPHGRHEPDDVAANHALVLLLRQLLDQTPCQISTTTRLMLPCVISPSNVGQSQWWVSERCDLTCLGLLALWHLVPFPLAGSVVLLVCSSPPSGLRPS